MINNLSPSLFLTLYRKFLQNLFELRRKKAFALNYELLTTTYLPLFLFDQKTIYRKKFPAF